MRLPRDATGADLAKRLEKLGYWVTRQTGSHRRLSCEVPSQHHVTVPKHDPSRFGTLAAILSDVAAHHKMSHDAPLAMLWS